MIVARVLLLARVQQVPKTLQPALDVGLDTVDVNRLQRLRQRLEHQQLWWLHIPKCGSSFETSYNMYTHDRSMDSGCHRPLPQEPAPRSVGNVRCCRASEL